MLCPRQRNSATADVATAQDGHRSPQRSGGYCPVRLAVRGSRPGRRQHGRPDVLWAELRNPEKYRTRLRPARFATCSTFCFDAPKKTEAESDGGVEALGTSTHTRKTTATHKHRTSW
ncbi:unnamed protein product [Amoebophrya sp. A25]|nr:unnamed protein product [Amoebophrya sp. A25]|eukprot:GSA25T00005343001.1